MDLTAWVALYCDRISVGLIAGAGFLTGIVASLFLSNVSLVRTVVILIEIATLVKEGFIFLI